MSLVDKKLIDWIISIFLLPDSGALNDPNIFKIIQTTCMTTNLGNFSYNDQITFKNYRDLYVNFDVTMVTEVLTALFYNTCLFYYIK